MMPVRETQNPKAEKFLFHSLKNLMYAKEIYHLCRFRMINWKLNRIIRLFSWNHGLDFNNSWCQVRKGHTK
jgi:hypothetical protein